MRAERKLNGWYKLRWKILQRDNFTCQYCGQSAPNVKLEVDHKVPIADGGTNDEDNLVTACYACNRGKNGLRQSIALSGHPRPSQHNREAPARKKIIEKLATGDVSASLIAKHTGIKLNVVHVLLQRLQKQGAVINKARGVWGLKKESMPAGQEGDPSRRC